MVEEAMDVDGADRETVGKSLEKYKARRRQIEQEEKKRQREGLLSSGESDLEMDLFVPAHKRRKEKAMRRALVQTVLTVGTSTKNATREEEEARKRKEAERAKEEEKKSLLEKHSDVPEEVFKTPSMYSAKRRRPSSPR